MPKPLFAHPQFSPLIPTGPTGPAGGDLTGLYPSPQIAPLAVSDDQIENVDWSKILNVPPYPVVPPSLPPSGPASGDLTGFYPNPQIAPGAVGDAEITDVAWTKITGAPTIPSTLPPSGAAGGVLTGTYPDPGLASNAVAEDNIRNEAVTASKIGDGEVTFPKLATNSVGVLAIIDGAVDRAKLAPNVWPNPIPTGADVGKVLTVNAGPLLAWATPAGGGGGISDAPVDGKLYGRKDAAWSEVIGGGITGSGAATQIGVWASGSAMSGSPRFTQAADGALTILQVASGMTPGVTYSTESSFIKLRIGCLTPGNFSFYSNAAFNNILDVPSQPALAWVYDAIVREFGFYGAPANPGGGTAVWAQMLALNASGMTLPTGDLTLFRDPTTALHAATKQYVDGKVGGAVGPDRKVRTLAGGTTVLDGTAEVHFASAISNATLPLASSCPGRIYEFAPANQINVGRSGSDTIVVGTAAGVTGLAVTANMRVTLISDGISAWRVISADPALSITGILAGGSLNGTFPNPGLVANAVANVQIATGAVSPLKMAGAVPSGADGGKFLIYDHTNPTTQFKVSLCAQDGSGNFQASGSLTTQNGTVNINSGATTRAALQAYPFGGSTIAEFVANVGQVITAKPVWMLRLDCGGAFDGVQLFRTAPSGGAQTALWWLDNQGVSTHTHARLQAIRCSMGGGSLSDGYSNMIGFGWNGSQITARVDNVAPGYLLTVTSASDERTKTNVQEDVPGLDAVLAMRPITFEYIPGFYPPPADGSDVPVRRHYGMIAQELVPLTPLVIQRVGEEEESYLGVEYQLLVPVLVQAIKDLAARVAALEEP